MDERENAFVLNLLSLLLQCCCYFPQWAASFDPSPSPAVVVANRYRRSPLNFLSYHKVCFKRPSGRQCRMTSVGGGGLRVLGIRSCEILLCVVCMVWSFCYHFVCAEYRYINLCNVLFFESSLFCGLVCCFQVLTG